MEKKLAVSKLRLFFIFPNFLNYYYIVGIKRNLESETKKSLFSLNFVFTSPKSFLTHTTLQTHTT